MSQSAKEKENCLSNCFKIFLSILMQDGQEAGSGSSGMDVMVKRNKSHNMQTNI